VLDSPPASSPPAPNDSSKLSVAPRRTHGSCFVLRLRANAICPIQVPPVSSTLRKSSCRSTSLLDKEGVQVLLTSALGLSSPVQPRRSARQAW
jgi:hypothetical protein